MNIRNDDVMSGAAARNAAVWVYGCMGVCVCVWVCVCVCVHVCAMRLVYVGKVASQGRNNNRAG